MSSSNKVSPALGMRSSSQWVGLTFCHLHANVQPAEKTMFFYFSRSLQGGSGHEFDSAQNEIQAWPHFCFFDLTLKNLLCSAEMRERTHGGET
jgi:hypothetical protein